MISKKKEDLSTNPPNLVLLNKTVASSKNPKTPNKQKANQKSQPPTLQSLTSHFSLIHELRLNSVSFNPID